MAEELVYIDRQGGEHVLPKLTISLAEKLAAPTAAETLRKRWAGEYEAVKAVLGKDETAKLLDGSTADKVDLAQLDAAFIGIKTAYEKPGREAQAEATAASMAQLEDIDVEKLEHIADALERLGQNVDRQAFKNVR